MGLEYLHTPMKRGEEMVTIDRHLYLSEDKTRVVEEGDPASDRLWATPGYQVSKREAIALGAIPPDPPVAPVKPVEPAVKQSPPASNKQRFAAGDKSTH